MTRHLTGLGAKALRASMAVLGAVGLLVVTQSCSSDDADSGGGAGTPGVAGKASGAGTSGGGAAAGGNTGAAGTAGAGSGGMPSAGSSGTGAGGTGGAPNGGSGGSSTAGSSSGGVTSAGAGGSTAGTAGATAGAGGGPALDCSSPSSTTPCLASQAGAQCENVKCGVLRSGSRTCTCDGTTMMFDCPTCVFACAATLCADDPVLSKPPGGIMDPSIEDCPAVVPGDGKPCGTFAEGYRCANKSDPAGVRNRLCGCGSRDGKVAWDCDSVPGFWK